jgi:prepilin-type processing-associated H-X9-DG protein
MISARAPIRPRGITLVKTLTVITIIGLLLSLLIPAVSTARMTVRKATCQSRLKQIALAVDEYSTANGCYSLGNSGRFSFRCSLLPFLEQSDLYQALNFDNPPGGNRTATYASVAAFVCPDFARSVAPPDLPKGSPPNAVAAGDFGAIASYVGNEGLGRTVRIGSGGPFSKSSRLQVVNPGPMAEYCGPSNVTDGASRTALLSEVIPHPYEPGASESAFPPVYRLREYVDDAQFLKECSTATDPSGGVRGVPWMRSRTGASQYTHFMAPNQRSCTAMKIEERTANGFIGYVAQAAITVGSRHPGGVYVCMADGSVSFVSDSISLDVWRAMGTQAGNEAVSY